MGNAAANTGNVGDIRGGMEVVGIDGQQIGMVTDVFLSPADQSTPDVSRPLTVPLPHKDRGQDGGAAITSTPAPHSFFRVDGADCIYEIPFALVATLFPGQSVMLECTKEECVSRSTMRRSNDP